MPNEADGGVEGASEPGVDTPGLPAQVQFHYVKSNFFRVVYAEGAWGGLSPAGRIVINFYNERAPIPLLQTVAVNPDGSLGAIVTAEGKSGILREVEVAVTMDVDHARELHKWLADKIGQYDQLVKAK